MKTRSLHGISSATSATFRAQPSSLSCRNGWKNGRSNRAIWLLQAHLAPDSARSFCCSNGNKRTRLSWIAGCSRGSPPSRAANLKAPSETNRGRRRFESYRPEISVDGFAAHCCFDWGCGGSRFSSPAVYFCACSDFFCSFSCREPRSVVGDSNARGTLERSSDGFDQAWSHHNRSFFLCSPSQLRGSFSRDAFSAVDSH